MSDLPDVIIFFETPTQAPIDVGGLLLQLAAAAWRYDRRTTLLIDADPLCRLTRAVRAPEHHFLPPTGAEWTLEDYLDAAANLEPSPPLAPWHLTRRARSLIPSGGNASGAHARALGTVVATGGALDLGERIDDLIRPFKANISLTLVLAPPPGAGLGALLGAHADLIVILGDTLEQMGPLLPAIDRLSLAVYPEGPDEILPVLLPSAAPRRPGRLPTGEPERLAPLVLEGTETPEMLLPLLRALRT